MFCFQVLGATVRFLHVLVYRLLALALLTMIFQFLDASFSSLQCFVFELYVYYFRALRIFSSLRRLLFSTRAPFSVHHVPCVFRSDCELRRFVTVRGVVVSLRCFKSLLYLCRSSIERRRPNKTFKEKYFKCCLRTMFPDIFVLFERHICVSY